jgi:NO-binding membrane sensor protein with MHYT domain
VAASYGDVNDFTYGVVTPLVAFVMACLGAALGLRCTVRALSVDRSRRAGWLALGATAIGSGIWTMHFIAMIGFSVAQVKIDYDKPVTFASLLVAIAVVGIGIFIVGAMGRGPFPLLLGGTITGLGVAVMHYLGMTGMRLPADFGYDPLAVAVSVCIAVLAATVALWCAVSIKGVYMGLAASLIMAVAVSGMHYVGMLGLQVHVHPFDASVVDHSTPAAALAPLLIGPVVFLFLAGVVVALDPLTMDQMSRRDLPEPDAYAVPQPDAYSVPNPDAHSGAGGYPGAYPDPAQPPTARHASHRSGERRPPEPW